MDHEHDSELRPPFGQVNPWMVHHIARRGTRWVEALRLPPIMVALVKAKASGPLLLESLVQVYYGAVHISDRLIQDCLKVYPHFDSFRLLSTSPFP